MSTTTGEQVDDREELAGYVDVWWQAINDFIDLLEELPDEEWSTPTDLPGWDVQAVASHVAHLEGILAGAPEETADVGEPPHVTGFMGLYTEIGVVTRRDASPDAIINEIRAAADRAAHHAARRPADRRRRPSPSRSSAASAGTGARCCATGRSTCGCTSRTSAAPSTAPAAWTPPRRGTRRSTSPRASASCSPSGSAPSRARPCVLELEGSDPFAFAVNDARRGERLPAPPADATVTLRMDREAFIRLAGGRCEPEPGTFAVAGDEELGRRLLDAMATTP